MAQDLHSAPTRDLQGEEGNHEFMFLIFLRQFTLPARLLQRLRDPRKTLDPVWSSTYTNEGLKKAPRLLRGIVLPLLFTRFPALPRHRGHLSQLPSSELTHHELLGKNRAPLTKKRNFSCVCLLVTSGR